MKKILVWLLFLSTVTSLHADIFEDIGKRAKKAVKKVKKSTQTATQTIQKKVVKPTGDVVSQAGKGITKVGSDVVGTLKDSAKLAQNAALDALKSAGLDVRGIEKSVAGIQAAVPQLNTDIASLQIALKAPRSPQSQSPIIAQRIKALQAELDRLKKMKMEVKDIKTMLSGPMELASAIKQVATSSIKSQMQKTHQAYDALLGTIDEVEVNPILQAARSALLDMAGVIDNSLRIREYSGALAKVVVAPKIAQALKGISGSLRSIAGDLQSMIAGGRRSLRSAQGDFASGFITNVKAVPQLIADIQKTSKEFPQYIAKMKEQVAHMMQLKNTLVSKGTGIGSRLESLVKAKVKSVKGTFDLPRAAAAELDTIIKELQRALNGIFRDLRDVIASSAGAITVGVEGMGAFKKNIGFDIVPPQSRTGFVALPGDVRDLSANVERLRVALPLR
jgi:hypothetical protein